MILVIEPHIEQIRAYTFDTAQPQRQESCISIDIEDITDKNKFKETLLKLSQEKKIDAVAFRILFGTDSFENPTVINASFLKTFSTIIHLYPVYCALSETIMKTFYHAVPDVPLVAYFETSFFNTLPEVEKYYALPKIYFDRTKIKRSGFHGIYHENNASLIGEGKNIISIVLDKQTTISAIKNRKPLSISLGYTPLEGVMGKTSCGDLDPGIIFYLMRRYNFSLYKIDDVLKKESGFFGLTGYDLNIDELFMLYGSDEKVTLAFDIYQNQILKYIGESISLLESLDVIVFSGVYVSALTALIHQLLKKINFLGINLAPLPWEKQKDFFSITATQSPVQAFINSSLPSQIIAVQTMEYLNRFTQTPIV
jgi:acetate kinase